ncbi:hypothetical protein M5K25_019502 [Dendrobium thyrsiflorum]|uniref:Uncharacterized protein n=1 Tax=Dendrobium thyrsiflorum TaxID=117978 RepID=A0ABD0ULX6_DENTH
MMRIAIEVTLLFDEIMMVAPKENKNKIQKRFQISPQRFTDEVGGVFAVAEATSGLAAGEVDAVVWEIGLHIRQEMIVISDVRKGVAHYVHRRNTTGVPIINGSSHRRQEPKHQESQQKSLKMATGEGRSHLERERKFRYTWSLRK